MGLFRLSHEPGSGEEERQLILDTDGEAQAAAPEDESPIGLGAAAVSQTGAEESTPPSGLEDIPIQTLLDDLVGVSRSLGITPHAPVEPSGDESRDVDAERDEEEDAAEPNPPEGSRASAPSSARYRRYALHVLLLSMAVAAAVVGLISAGQFALTALPDSSPAQGHSRPPVVVATVPGIAPGLDGEPQTAVEPTPEVPTEPTPKATPEPTPELQPAYFLYTVQPGDAVFDIADTFAISPDYVLWNNPDVIEDPNLLLVGQELLIPSVNGIIYRVKPGDTLSRIAALYQIDVDSIVGFAPNGLTSPNDAIAGMVLILPGAVPPLLPQPPEVIEPTGSQPQPTEPTPTPEAPTPSEPQAVQPAPTPEAPAPSEPQATEPTPTPEAPAPSEPQAVQPTPTGDESPPFSIGRISPE